MNVIPAIDIKDGKVVRLTQGDASKVTIYSDDPLAIAKKWESFGVELIHIVDLDGALEGKLKNFDIIKNIAASIKPRIELGGGIRDIETIGEVFTAGIERACIGTMALDREFLRGISRNFKNKIIISIDAHNGIVYSKGWVFKTRRSVIDLADEAANLGFTAINYTDISKDGMMEGPNIQSIKKLLRSTNLDIVAAGGISSIEDVKALQSLEPDGLKGMIIGKALYENKIDLGEAIKICSQNV